ncbi:MAG: nucleoside triphosphate pyrophosphohydrolase [Chloroflexi bacterium]|nr:nucleoside triphosphate pyrophosphohydrolase [Chloroflexota bacterium]
MTGSIDIVGLGPGDANLLTRQVWDRLSSASEVYLRTQHHPCVPALPKGVTYHSFDDCYEAHAAFEGVYADIAARVLALGRREQGVVYAVPGDPAVGERTVQMIREQAAAEGVAVRLYPGLSFIEPTCQALGCDPFDGLQIVDATLLAARLHPPLDPDVPALVVQLYNRQMAADAKLTLLALYPEEHPTRLVMRAGLNDQIVRDMPLFEVDRQDDLDHLSSLYLLPLPHPGSLSTYQDVVARLRAPDGCPWDREQTHDSLRSSLLEETYEVLAALDDGDADALREELGDLLLQVLFHAQISTEDGDFRLIDSMAHAIEKLIRRHPHVFGDARASDAQEVLLSWEQIKREERKSRPGEQRSMLASISTALPSLAQAMDIQQRVVRVGFDWPEVGEVLAKVDEELAELAGAPDRTAREAELGDVFFSLVNVARWYDLDPESALRQANGRFRRRFAWMEAEAHRLGTPLEGMAMEEMDALWERAKEAEG